MSPIAFSRPTVPPAFGAQDGMASDVNGYANMSTSTSTSTITSTKHGAHGNPNFPAANGNGRPGGGSGGGKAPFRHIDDLVSIGADLDPHTPLRKVLEIGDGHMRQAVTFNDFRRPDLALQEYIKAFTIAVDAVPKHKDYPSLKSDRGDLGRLYNALKVKITKNGETFDKIKALIKEDNKRSGVQPTRPSRNSSDMTFMNLPSVPSSDPSQSQARNHSSRNNDTKLASGFTEQSHSRGNSVTNPTLKSKPTVHPKPQALHGNALAPGAKTTPQDLSNRFAKLRDHQSAINGVASPLKPVGPREMPTTHRPKVSVNASVPPMPKVPDAIYSPARGTITSEVADLPSSTPRGMFSRTNSIASVPSASARTSMEKAIRAYNGEHFVTAHTYGDSPPSPRPSGIEIPEGETITPQELLAYMKRGSSKAQLLIIDVRDREAFDDGHIMSQRTICVEPEVLSRENISADDIQDSMILADPTEKLAFEQRDKVDLVIVYDQDSMSVPQKITRNTHATIVYTIIQALTHYSYSRQLRNPPKLLAGGLDAWVEELGVQSLAVSKTAQAPRRPRGPRALDRRRARTKTKTLNQKEIEQFEKSIKADEAASSPNDYYRSAEEVMRRFPSVSQLQESMTSPPDASPLSEEEDIYDKISPAPPARPAPAVPRTRYSGLETKDDGSSSGIYAKKGVVNLARRKRTGLENPFQWCYCNSVLQALLASPQFTNEVTRSEWPISWRPADHTLDRPSPQLLSRIIGSIFQYLNNRQFDVMRAGLLMNYLRSIHQGYEYRNKLIKFGDNEQHDAEELTTFLLDQLDMETNTRRNLNAAEPDFKTPTIQNRQAPLGDVLNTWLAYYDRHRSIVDKYWQNVISQEFTCTNPKCNAKSYKLEAEPFVLAYPAEMRGGRIDSLPAAFDREFAPDEVLETTCETCQHKYKKKRNFLLRAAPLLCVKVLRTIHTSRVPLKNTYPIEFPFDDLDLRKHSYDKAQLRPFLGNQPAGMLGGYEEDPVYDLYAIVIHSGPDSHSGHYWTWVREGSGSQWTRCNDSRIDEVDMSLSPHSQRDLYECKGKETPVMLFYKRKDIPWASRDD